MLLVILVMLKMLGASFGFVLILIPVAYILTMDAVPVTSSPSQMLNAIE